MITELKNALDNVKYISTEVTEDAFTVNCNGKYYTITTYDNSYLVSDSSRKITINFSNIDEVIMHFNYVIDTDKWYVKYVVSQLLVDELNAVDIEHPTSNNFFASIVALIPHKNNRWYKMLLGGNCFVRVHIHYNRETQEYYISGSDDSGVSNLLGMASNVYDIPEIIKVKANAVDGFAI